MKLLVNQHNEGQVTASERLAEELIASGLWVEQAAPAPAEKPRHRRAKTEEKDPTE